MIALYDVAAHTIQHLDGTRTFHPLGHHPQAHVVSQVDNGVDEDGVTLIPLHILYEGAVDLELVHGQALEVGKGGKTGAEIIDGQAHPDGIQGAHYIHGAVHVGHHGAFGDFQHQLIRGHQPVAEQLGDLAGALCILQATGREVHRHLQVQAGLAPVVTLAQGLAQHPVGERKDQAALFRQGYEFIRRNIAIFGMIPAYQRLDAHHPPGFQAQLGLVMQLQLVLLDGGPQFRHEGQAAHAVAVLPWFVDGIAQVVFLRLVHRHVGMLEQGLGIGSVVRVHGDADTDIDIEIHTGSWDRGFQAIDDLFRAALGSAQGGVGQQDGKFVAAQTCDGVAPAQQTVHPFPHGLQQQIPAVMPEGVVDFLETIQVQDEQADGIAVAMSLFQGVGQAFEQQGTVGQAGQAIVQRPVGEGGRFGMEIPGDALGQP